MCGCTIACKSSCRCSCHKPPFPAPTTSTATDPLEVEAIRERAWNLKRVANASRQSAPDRNVRLLCDDITALLDALAAAHAEKEAMGENLRIALERMIATVAERDAIAEKIAVAIEAEANAIESSMQFMQGLCRGAAIARKVGRA